MKFGLSALLVIAVTTLNDGSPVSTGCFNFFKSKRPNQDTQARGPPEYPCLLPSPVIRSNVSVSNGPNGESDKTFHAKDFEKVLSVQWSGAEEKALYTFLFFERSRERFHWGVINIKGSVFTDMGEIASSDQLMEYMPPRSEKIHVNYYEARIYRQIGKNKKVKLRQYDFGLNQFLLHQKIPLENLVASTTILVRD